MFGLTTTRRLRAVQTAARSEQERLRIRAERAEERARTAEFNREQVLRQLAEADAANRRLHGRNLELGRQVSALAESDLEYAAQLERRVAQLEQRVARLKRVGKRIVAAWRREQKRADHLQQRLDNARGLNSPAVEAGRHWQATRTDGGRKGVAS
jgi:chromosome segregation ATPase